MALQPIVYHIRAGFLLLAAAAPIAPASFLCGHNCRSRPKKLHCKYFMRHVTLVLPFRWILPFAQLFLSAVILWPIVPSLANQIQASLGEYRVVHDRAAGNQIASRTLPFVVDLSNPELQRQIKSLQAREWAVAILNLPGSLPDMTYAILSPAHTEWTPRGMFMWTWRDLSWPVIAILFWWIAGRSIEALLSARSRTLLPKIRWWEVVVSIPVGAFGAIFAVIVGGNHTEFPMWTLLVALSSVWFVLGISTSVAYIVQWRIRKRLVPSPLEQPSITTVPS